VFSLVWSLLSGIGIPDQALAEGAENSTSDHVFQAYCSHHFFLEEGSRIIIIHSLTPNSQSNVIFIPQS